ncbi:flagellar basal body-associated protein FliL [Oceanobacillus massiliensis]|uniref:flagellar basal body-associated protein FliL n=1 Tax=Oceanobacillus massiliensis TaxID=1465765 RepID=UPI000289C392|nr:flagellar basal body-associated protein FliL [Oceanobacillus massiliensis]
MSKLVKTMITSLVVLLIGAVAALVVVLNIAGENKEGEARSIDDIVEYSYETPEITTDLADGAFVRIQFQIVTDGKEAKEEISKRDFQLKNILIKELATKSEEDFKAGLGELEQVVKNKLNELMTEGQITEVYTINKILQ